MVKVIYKLYLNKKVYKSCSLVYLMANFSLGSNNPKKEISLSPVMSILLILLWLVLMGSIIYMIYDTFIAEDPHYYVICSNGNRIEYQENRSEYCGMIFDSFNDVEDYIDEQIENYDPFDELDEYSTINMSRSIQIMEIEDGELD